MKSINEAPQDSKNLTFLILAFALFLVVAYLPLPDSVRRVGDATLTPQGQMIAVSTIPFASSRFVCQEAPMG